MKPKPLSSNFLIVPSAMSVFSVRMCIGEKLSGINLPTTAIPSHHKCTPFPSRQANMSPVAFHDKSQVATNLGRFQSENRIFIEKILS